ncbi:MAG: hypothetical protein HZC55_13110 [Verrucomicrobia bacterium]|nr:hypothetical protein [Verrucomicrobiota bacterium]
MSDLSRYGGACRCLLRLRENLGAPGRSDAAFIAEFLPRYPEWRDFPGATDLFALLELAKALLPQTAGRFEVFRDYARILREHRSGQGIIIYTERAPEQNELTLEDQRHVLLLVEADEDAFVVWCPYRSGQSALLPRAERRWWDRWLAIGIVLQPPGMIR